MDKIQICLLIMAISVALFNIGRVLPRYGKYRWQKHIEEAKTHVGIITPDDVLWKPAKEFLNIALMALICVILGLIGFISSFICATIYFCKAVS